MALSKISHGDWFKWRRRHLPQLVEFFRGPDGGPGLNATAFRYSTRKLLGIRETPISGDAFRYWLMAYLQRRTHAVVEAGLPWLRPWDADHPDDPDGLIRLRLRTSPTTLREDLRRYRRVYVRGGAAALRELEDVTANDWQAISGFAVAHLFEALQKRYRYIAGGAVGIARECAQLAGVPHPLTVRATMRAELNADAYERMAVDIRNMARGANRQDWTFIRRVQAHVPLRLGAAFGSPHAAIDLLANDATMVEIKPFRHIAEKGSCDQMVAHYLLYCAEHPDNEVEDLRFYCARHPAWAIASVEEIAQRFPLWEFGDLLFTAEQEAVEKGLRETFERYCERERQTATNRAFARNEQRISIERRFERAGRIGVTWIHEVRQQPEIVEDRLLTQDDAYLPEHLRSAAENTRLLELWRGGYERHMAQLQVQAQHLAQAREVWRAFMESRFPQARLG